MPLDFERLFWRPASGRTLTNIRHYFATIPRQIRDKSCVDFEPFGGIGGF